jgi:hypothetical protein
MNLLDNLQPDDFINGGNFNQAEVIIDQVCKALLGAVVKGQDADEFIQKAVANFLRDDSVALSKVTNLFQVYLKMKLL